MTGRLNLVLALFPIMNEASRELFSKSRVVPISGKWKAERLEDIQISKEERDSFWTEVKGTV